MTKKYSGFLLTGALFGLGMNPVVHAHAILVKSVPEKETVITQSPAKVEVWFNDAVGRKYQALAVSSAKGKRVDNRDVKQDASDGAHLSATLKPMEPGKYRVRYRVQSADGHILSGKYYFTLGQGEGQSSDE